MMTAAPLFEAVRYGNAAIFEVLLRHGARVDYTNRFGQTVLHIAASWANVPGRRIVDETRDRRNCTAREVFMTRFAPPAGFASAFERVIDYVRRLYAEVENGADEKEVLVNAFEVHDLVDCVEGLTLVEL